MKKAKEQHLERVAKVILALVDKKYRKGDKEHAISDPLLDMSEEVLASEILEEMVDALIYVITLREKQMRKKSFKK